MYGVVQPRIPCSAQRGGQGKDWESKTGKGKGKAGSGRMRQWLGWQGKRVVWARIRHRRGR